MNASTDFWRSLIGLLVKRLPWLVAFAAIGALLGYVGADRDPVESYEARTLVVANRWEQRIEGLSRLVETIAQTNEYQERLQLIDTEAFPAATTFSRVIDIVPVQTTVAVWVEATGGTPEIAQRRANVAGEALVSELNRLGDGIGIFTVQDRAPLPTEPIESELDPKTAAALGALAGSILASGFAVAWPAPSTPESGVAPETNRDLEADVPQRARSTTPAGAAEATTPAHGIGTTRPSGDEASRVSKERSFARTIDAVATADRPSPRDCPPPTHRRHQT